MSDTNIVTEKESKLNWTQSAIDCYFLGCSCAKCNLYKIYFLPTHRKCMMKKTVLKLVRNIGRPLNIRIVYEKNINK